MQCSKLLVTSISQPCSYRFLRGASSTCKQIKFTDASTHGTSFILAQPAVFMGIDWTPTDLCNHANTTGNDGSFSLSATHAPQARGYEDTPPQVIRAQFIRAVSEAHLSDCGVQVVHDHEHDGGRLARAAWVLIDRVAPPQVDRGAEAVHVDVSVLPQLLSKFGGKGSSGNPLHISLREHILEKTFCLRLEQKPEHRVPNGDLKVLIDDGDGQQDTGARANGSKKVSHY
ncbi:hypothetical protein EYF80_030027 [Liparis tanakae]|uniref:Uncharacterized protein n=1 Tax=Liparis tanakae TaxID=230148 RepID=A0A4Z2H4L1_9TELE|nr:hypothetical protein EYF80_030027 [Liparis tanakae]